MARMHPSHNEVNSAQARLKALRVSPRKLSLLADMIRGMKVAQALRSLAFSDKRIARDVGRLLESAIANAENNHGLDVDRLYVSRVEVGKSIVMKRWRARARGRMGRYHKFFSNLLIVVREQEAEMPAPKKAVKKVKKAATKKKGEARGSKN